jgi:hypothetical protein
MSHLKTQIDFNSSTNYAYEPELSFERFVRLANSQFRDSDIPDYAGTGTHNSVRYAATYGDFMMEYSESTLSGIWWVVNNGDHCGSGTSIVSALEDWNRRVLSDMINAVYCADEPDDYLD